MLTNTTKRENCFEDVVSHCIDKSSLLAEYIYANVKQRKNMLAENDKRRKQLSYLTMYRESSIVSMTQLSHEKDAAVMDCDAFRQMNDDANNKIIASMKQQHIVQVKELHNKLSKSSRYVMKLEEKLRKMGCKLVANEE